MLAFKKFINTRQLRIGMPCRWRTNAPVFIFYKVTRTCRKERKCLSSMAWVDDQIVPD